MGKFLLSVAFAGCGYFLFKQNNTGNTPLANGVHYTEHEQFSQQAEIIFKKISKRRNNEPYPTLLHDYQVHILSYGLIPPKILKKRDVKHIDRLFRRFPQYAAELYDLPTVSTADTNKSPETERQTKPPAEPGTAQPVAAVPGPFRMFADFDAAALRHLVHVYNTGDTDRALFLSNNPSILRHSASTPISDEIVKKWITSLNDTSYITKYIAYFDQSIRNSEGNIDGYHTKIAIQNLINHLLNHPDVMITFFCICLCYGPKLFYQCVQELESRCNIFTMYLFYYYITYVYKSHPRVLYWMGL